MQKATLAGRRAAVKELATVPPDLARARAKQTVLEADLSGSEDPNAPLQEMSRRCLVKVIATGWNRNTHISTERALDGEDEIERRDAILQNRPYEERFPARR